MTTIICVGWVARNPFRDWYKSRKRWSSAEIDAYRKMLDNELLDKNVQDGLAKRYNADTFFLNTGLRSRSYEDIPRLILLLNDNEKQISEQTLRMVYPKYLKFENGIPRVRLTRSDRFENWLRNFLKLLSFGYLGFYMSSVDPNHWGIPFIVPTILLMRFWG